MRVGRMQRVGLSGILVTWCAHLEQYVYQLILRELFCVPLLFLVPPAVPYASLKGISAALPNHGQASWPLSLPPRMNKPVWDRQSATSDMYGDQMGLVASIASPARCCDGEGRACHVAIKSTPIPQILTTWDNDTVALFCDCQGPSPQSMMQCRAERWPRLKGGR